MWVSGGIGRRLVMIVREILSTPKGSEQVKWRSPNAPIQVQILAHPLLN